MRVNVYAEEMTDRIEIISKEIDGQRFTGLRLYLELPATVGGAQYQGPFMHRPGDDDSSAVTFWGKRDLREVLRAALTLLDHHYGQPGQRGDAGGEGTLKLAATEPHPRSNCPGCGHVHSGVRLAFICIGCPCDLRPATSEPKTGGALLRAARKGRK